MAVTAIVNGATDAPSPRPTKRRGIIGAVLLGAWSLLTLWAGFRLANAWPYVGLMPQWLLLLALPGVVFRAADLAWLRMKGRPVAGWRRVPMRLAAIVAGGWAAVVAWEALDVLSWARFEQAVAPLVTRVSAGPGAMCATGPAAGISPDLAAYLADADAPRAAAELHWNAQRFVLSLPGRSMDIDGSTLYFDSRAGRWKKVHNDTLQRSGEFQALTDGLATCRFPLR